MDFKHVSKGLTAEDVEKLKKWHSYYHELATCYKWKYKKLNRVKLGLNMLSITLTAVGAGLSAISLVTLSITGVGVVIQGLLSKTDLSQKVERCKFAYTSYEKILVQLRTILRGMPFDEEVLLTEMKVIDDIIVDMIPIGEKLINKYRKRYV